MITTFEKPGSLQKPGPIGRAIRIGLGCGFLYLFILTIAKFTHYVSSDIPRQPMIWFGVALCLFFLADVVNVGFSRSWGRWPQFIAFLLALAAIAFDLLKYGSPWGPPLGLLVFVLLVYVTGYLGLSFILAAVLAVPG